MMASWIACPCVCETVEMSTPRPRVTKRNSTEPRVKVATEPRKGTSKSTMPTATMTAMSMAAIGEVGGDLADEDVARAERHDGELLHGARLALAHHAERGRDGADEDEDDAAQPGHHDHRRAQVGVEEDLGLGRADDGESLLRRGGERRTRRRPNRRRPTADPAPYDPCRSPAIACAAEMRRSAAWAAKSSDPSISTVAGSPAAAGVTKATTASPRRSASSAAARSSPGLTATTSN